MHLRVLNMEGEPQQLGIEVVVKTTRRIVFIITALVLATPTMVQELQSRARNQRRGGPPRSRFLAETNELRRLQ